MRPVWRRALDVGGPIVAWIMALAAGAYALAHPSVLIVDFGAGDEAVAAGFPGGWARYEVRGRTTFRWTGANASLVLPFAAKGRAVEVELRLGRFAERATAVAVLANDRSLAAWEQHPVGWRERRLPAVAWDGPIALEFRAPAEEGEPSGIALDWLALRGVERCWPRPRAWLGLLALLLGAPLVASLWLRRATPLTYGAPAALLGLALWSLHDSVAAITMATLAGPRVLIAIALALPVAALLARLVTPALMPTSGAWLWAPVIVVPIVLLALSSPRYHYPDVDTHARFLAGMRAQPRWALDPREYQEESRAWTRFIGGRFVGFPYSAAFHVLAWPLAPALGEVGAVKTTAAMALAVGLVLVFGLARAAGASPGTAALAQAFFALLPVVPSRLTLALLPSLLGQMMELLLLLALATRLGALETRRERFWALALLFLVQASYVGSLFNVAAIVAFVALIEARRGRWHTAVVVLALYALPACGVALLQYRYFVPTLLSEVLPRLGTGPAAGGAAPLPSAGLQAATRLWIFFGPFGLALALFGAVALARAEERVRQTLCAATAAGLLLALLRAGVPVLFSDAKEVELLAGPIAVVGALGAAWLWRRQGAWRLGGVALVAALVVWAALRAADLYASRLTFPSV